MHILSSGIVADLDNDICGTTHGDRWSVTSWLGPSNRKFSLAHMCASHFLLIPGKGSCRRIFERRSDMITGAL